MIFSSKLLKNDHLSLGHDLWLKTTRLVSGREQRELTSRTLDQFTGFAITAVALLALLSSR
jgi:hypothetical protein